MKYKRSFFVIIFIFITIQLKAEISLPNFFSDHMVLQQKEDIMIFGQAKPLESVEVTFNGITLKTITSRYGKWAVIFKPMNAGGPFEMILKGENSIVLKDIYIGEVWFCSGQSNMGWPIEKSENGIEDLQNANFEKIKLLNVRRSMSSNPEEDIHPKNKWKTSTTKNAKGFSAAAYYFGKALYERYNVPIGLIHSSWGGSNIEAWMDLKDLDQNDPATQQMEKFKTIELNELLKLYKIDEKEYHKYLDSVDIGTKETWQLLKTDYSDWKTLKLPKTWEKTQLKQRFGIVWVTKTIQLSKAEIEEKATLSLGRIDNEDITYINGIKVGGLVKNDIDRIYRIPNKVLKVGKNRIVIRVKNPMDTGGFRSSAKDVFLKIGEKKISLANQWNYKVATPNVKTPPSRVHPKYLPSSLYNAMTNPFFRYNIKGVIWYQGETNMSRADEYADLFPKMITDWREKWKKDLPFLFVQLPNLANKNNRLPKFREAQKKALTLDNVGMVTAIDIGDDYNIHPKNKKDIGNRLAIVANDLVYGNKENNYQPVISKIETESNYLKITFKNEIKIKGDTLNILGFEISVDSRNYKTVSAKLINPTTIKIEYFNSEAVINLRYLCKDAPEKVMIYGGENLPLSPFQTRFK